VGASLFALRATGDRAPLVLVHGHDGHALIYALLARRLPPAHPIWAFELDADPGVDRADDLRIEAIAERHVAALRDALPDGPYLLAGFCYGGVVAFETARQLHADGEMVTMLALLGIGPTDFPGPLSERALARWHQSLRPVAALRHAANRVGGLTWPQRRDYLKDRACAVGRRAGAIVSARGRARRRRSAAARDAFDAFRADRYEGRATLVLPAWSTARYTDDASTDWAPLAASVQVHEVPGSHKAMLREPVVSVVAEMVSRELAALDTDA